MERQWDNIAVIRQLLVEDSGIEVAFVTGELADGSPNVNSAVQICCGVNPEFDAIEMLSRLEKHFSENLLKAFLDKRTHRIILCFRLLPKIEINYKSALDADFRGTLPTALFPEKASPFLLFDRSDSGKDFIGKASGEKIQTGDTELSISYLTDSFLIEFEACSCSHRRGHASLFYKSFNKALHKAEKLCDLSKGRVYADFNVHNSITEERGKPVQKIFPDAEGRLNLHDANQQKRELLDFYYLSVRRLVSASLLEENILFCEAVFKRDFLWNFRDISQFNPRIKPGLIYRTATLTLIQDEDFFEALLFDKKIKTAIDLRAKSETNGQNYSDKALEYFTWINAPIAHLELYSELRKSETLDATTKEIYRFFALDSTDSVKAAMEAILNSVDPLIIHCHSGKDRTGFLVTLLHLLSGAGLETVYDDYLASEMDTKKEYLDVILRLIVKKGGIENYLLYCGLNLPQIEALKQKLRK